MTTGQRTGIDPVGVDPLQEQVEAVEHLTRLVAGDDGERHLLVFQALLNQVDTLQARPGEDGAQLAGAMLLRTAEPHLARPRPRRGRRASSAGRGAAPPPSIYADPVYQRNATALIGDAVRIVGGVVTSDFPDAVAVGHRRGWCCTGTLVAPNVVVTAAHCLPDCAQQIFIGEDVERPRDGRVIAVRAAVAHPGYRPPDPTDDIAVLILAEPVDDVAPRAIADPGAVDAAETVRLVGYGNTDVQSRGGYGRRRMVDVPVAGADPRLGADLTREFVAGVPFLDRDSCNGDSGGPAYVAVDGDWQLAGATSRATASAVRPCGDGGIYTRVPFYADWIRSVPGGLWG
jgi:hypothetical protein